MRDPQGRSHRLAVLGATLRWDVLTAGLDRRAAARSLLRRELGAAVRFSAVCPQCGGPHGPLTATLPDGRAPLVSVAYADPLVVVGVAPRGARAFGIDAELDSPSRRRAVLEAIGSSELFDWTRLEAIAKARHLGLGVDDVLLQWRQHGSGWIAASVAGHPELRGSDLVLSAPGASGAAAISVAVAAARARPHAEPAS